jgi:hypothetical protein
MVSHVHPSLASLLHIEPVVYDAEDVSVSTVSSKDHALTFVPTKIELD